MSGKTAAGGPAECVAGTSLVTVEADQVQVESRLCQLGCPARPGVLAPWGWAWPCGVRGVGSFRPRRGRCVGCLATHVLMPVIVVAGGAAEVIGAALVARAVGTATAGSRCGSGAGRCGWWRRMGSRLAAVRVYFLVVARL